ncbi:uncharacterized protein LOC142046864 [Chelonoidis abingdonii]|uniref:uncharacterized protein LOC142046864 n=1 Tax=Chelonoidis abingdonii TaxID=106734 RepID=UPI003F4978F6
MAELLAQARLPGKHQVRDDITSLPVPPLSVDSDFGIEISSVSEDVAEGEDGDEFEDEDDRGDSTQQSVNPNSQDLFETQESQSLRSQARSPDSEAMEATSAAHFSEVPMPSRGCAVIRRRKKKTRDEMFTEIIEVTRNERDKQNDWKDVVAKYRKDASERSERARQEDQRWREATLDLLRSQTDILQRMVELQEEQHSSRVPLQPLYNLPASPRPISPHQTFSAGNGLTGVTSQCAAKRFCLTPEGAIVN